MKAKKSFGQYFLTDEAIASRIAASLTQAKAVVHVLEVGPGKGVLTKYLARQDINLRVVEADKDMVNYLVKHRIVDESKIIFLDFLKLILAKVFDGKPFLIIGNYPYNISSQILIKMVNHRELVPEMVGMFQKEVADRVLAPPGSKSYGVISVLVQAYYGAICLWMWPLNRSARRRRSTLLSSVSPERITASSDVMKGFSALWCKRLLAETKDAA